MIHRDVAQLKHYSLAVALSLLALPIALALDAPSSCFILVVMASSLYGGRGPALGATLMGSLAFELFFLPPGQHYLPTRASFFRFGVFLGAMLLTMEMIERKRRSDRARLQLDEDFRSLAETSPDSIISVDQADVVQFANPSITRMFGFPIQEVQGKPVSLILPDLTPGQLRAGEYSVHRKNGEAFDVEATCGSFGSKTTIFLRDISDRKRMQRKLQESEESLRLTLETIPGLVYTRSPDGAIEYANRRLSEYLGSTLDDGSTAALSESIHPDEKDRVLRQLKQNFETGLPYTMEYRSRRHDGAYRWLQTSLQPLRSRDGAVTRWYALLTDVDDLRGMEESLRRTQEKLARAAQIATVSEFAASIVHEISQPISAMVANGQACLRWLNATPLNSADAHSAVERIVRDGKDAAEVIKGLRSLFRRSPPEKIALDLRTIVTEVASLVRGRMESDGIALETHIPKNLPPVLGDKIQLQQVLMNLVTNGIDSMGNVDNRPKRLIVRARHDDDSVLTQIEDSGTGIADLNSIFDSFFTTKEKGMGMGLSICRSIVEAHSGRLWAESNPAGGAIFSFTVPVGEGGDGAA
jgi:PAS domain S-box-containing protein